MRLECKVPVVPDRPRVKAKVCTEQIKATCAVYLQCVEFLLNLLDNTQ